ncbi:hypothetical protein BC567DRAFT_211170 [Phyllosticta citribraziliensis]
MAVDKENSTSSVAKRVANPVEKAQDLVQRVELANALPDPDIFSPYLATVALRLTETIGAVIRPSHDAITVCRPAPPSSSGRRLCDLWVRKRMFESALWDAGLTEERGIARAPGWACCIHQESWTLAGLSRARQDDTDSSANVADYGSAPAPSDSFGDYCADFSVPAWCTVAMGVWLELSDERAEVRCVVCSQRSKCPLGAPSAQLDDDNRSRFMSLSLLSSQKAPRCCIQNRSGRAGVQCSRDRRPGMLTCPQHVQLDDFVRRLLDRESSHTKRRVLSSCYIECSFTSLRVSFHRPLPTMPKLPSLQQKSWWRQTTSRETPPHHPHHRGEGDSTGEPKRLDPTPRIISLRLLSWVNGRFYHVMVGSDWDGASSGSLICRYYYLLPAVGTCQTPVRFPSLLPFDEQRLPGFSLQLGLWLYTPLYIYQMWADLTLFELLMHSSSGRASIGVVSPRAFDYGTSPWMIPLRLATNDEAAAPSPLLLPAWADAIFTDAFRAKYARDDGDGADDVVDLATGDLVQDHGYLQFSRRCRRICGPSVKPKDVIAFGRGRCNHDPQGTWRLG